MTKKKTTSPPPEFQTSISVSDCEEMVADLAQQFTYVSGKLRDVDEQAEALAQVRKQVTGELTNKFEKLLGYKNNHLRRLNKKLSHACQLLKAAGLARPRYCKRCASPLPAVHENYLCASCAKKPNARQKRHISAHTWTHQHTCSCGTTWVSR